MEDQNTLLNPQFTLTSKELQRPDGIQVDKYGIQRFLLAVHMWGRPLTQEAPSAAIWSRAGSTTAHPTPHFKITAVTLCSGCDLLCSAGGKKSEGTLMVFH